MNAETIDKQVSCKDDYDPASLPADQALGRILQAITPLTSSEKIPLRESLGRVLAEDIQSPVNVPAGTNSAMDGYALNSLDIPAEGIAKLAMAGTALAGRPWKQPVNRGKCVRIMTGALMPAGTDTVVMQEHVRREAELVCIDNTIEAGSNVRAAGEDISKDDQVLAKGSAITPADIGLLASLGQAEIKVSRRLKVAFFSTGDELRSIGETLDDGQIYDSNRYTLFGMLQRLGVEVIDMGVVRDDPAALQDAFLAGANQADVLITSGGVSVGEADFVKDILQAVGTVNFWKVAMKPGRPLAFGRIQDCWFFGLPGNPVSVMVTFYQFVQPALHHLMGATVIEPCQFRVVCQSRLKKKPGRVEYQRGILTRAENGQLVVRKTGMQGSGILRSMAQANCFIILPMDAGQVEPGTEVNVQPFFGLV